jgi:hypothetical protein
MNPNAAGLAAEAAGSISRDRGCCGCHTAFSDLQASFCLVCHP